MSSPGYQRARTDDQKAERAAELLSAAEALLAQDPDPRNLSLTELARAAGMAKSNVYRYFESREAILLALLAESTHAWVAGVAARLGSIRADAPLDLRLTAALNAVAVETAARPRMCHLLSALPSVLEHNVSTETVVGFKYDVLAAQAPLVAAMHRALPELSPDALAELLRHGTAYIIGVWPLSHPPDAVRAAYARPGLDVWQHRFQPDLLRALTLMARGLLAER